MVSGEGTITFTTLRAELNPTAESVAALLPILQAVKEAGAGDRFPMELILHVTRQNMDGVRQVVTDLERAGFISNYKAQGLWGEIERFKSVVFR